jgi:pectate lyase
MCASSHLRTKPRPRTVRLLRENPFATVHPGGNQTSKLVTPMQGSFVRGLGLLVSICSLPLAVSAATYDGYGRNTTGGAGGTSVTVTNAAQLKTYAESTTTYVITVSGTINLAGVNISVKSNKTIQGANSSATIKNGTLDLGSGGVNNVVIRNLNITNPNGDGVTCWGATNVFCTKVNFYDCGDGSFDITQGASKVTVSWCKFSYPTQTAHRFCMILGNVDVSQNYETTLHHNWFANGCDQRMPSGSYSMAHVYNNYFNCAGNSYCTNARDGANWIVENNYYSGVKNPLYEEGTGKIKSSGNTFSSCTGKINIATGTGFTLPYSYTLTATSSVPSVVTAGAGNI